MEDKEIIELLIQELIEAGEWFTTKKDPTFEEAPSYYELDQYGDPTENTKKKIVNEIKDYIGDGAVDIENAIELWINEATMQYKVSFIDNLVTQFEPKPVVDQIEAYEVKLESKKQESEFANEDLLNGDIDIIFENKEIVKEAKLVKDIEKFGEETEYIDKKGNTLNVGDLIYLPDKGYHLLRYSDNGGYYLYRPSLGFRQGPTTSKNGELIYKYNEIADKPLSNPYLEENKLIKNTTNKKIKTYNIKTESAKTKMEEENTKSLNLISSMFTSEDFDADSPQGQIVIKTSQLFNELSDKGYNVQVNFDNGESQSDILLGDIGGKVTITINGTNEPIKAFTQGSFELTDDIINTLNEIKDLVDNI